MLGLKSGCLILNTICFHCKEYDNVVSNLNDMNVTSDFGLEVFKIGTNLLDLGYDPHSFEEGITLLEEQMKK